MDDIDLKGQDDFTAVNYAMSFKNYEIAKMLAKLGTSLEIADGIFHLTAKDRARIDGVEI